MLADVFDDEDHPPDAEFGAFAAVLGLKGSPFEDNGLLRAHIGAVWSEVQKTLSEHVRSHVTCAVSPHMPKHFAE